MDERRKLQRRHIMFYSRVFDTKTGKLLGYLGNLTPGGAMIISEEPIDVDLVFRLRMDLPEDLYDQARILFVAKSVWSSEDVDPRFFNTGFEFQDLAEDDREIIAAINQDYGFRED